MRKIKYLFLLIIILFLSGCELFSSLNTGLIELIVEDNLRISIYELENYDWNKSVSLNYLGSEISADQLKIDVVDDTVKIGEAATIKVTYGNYLPLYKTEFFAIVTDGHYMISDLKDVKDNTVVKINGTISHSDETGLIISDSTGSIFVELQNAYESFNRNSTLTILGTYSDGNIINHQEIEYNDNKIQMYAEETVKSEQFELYFKDDFEVKFISSEGVVCRENNTFFISLDDGSKLTFNYNTFVNTYELYDYLDQRINFSGWVYDYDKTTNSFSYMHVMVNHVFETAKIGNAPVIEGDAKYFYLDKKINRSSLLSYFSVYDVEDNTIQLSDNNLIGIVDEGQNILTIHVKDSDNNISYYSFVVEIEENKDYINENVNITNPIGMPSEGTVRVLVIPIGFDDYPKTSSMINNLKIAFFGSASGTGWESLTSYYQKSSYGKLNIIGTVTDWYTPKKSLSYYSLYEDEDNYKTGSTILLEEALTYYSSIYDYSNYDSNDDGYIDAVYLIYNNPVGGNGFTSQEEFYWAFTTWDSNADERDYDDIKGFGYVFMGYDFFERNMSYVNRNFGFNCETVIHETGHLLGLVDYYDYDDTDDNNSGGYGGCDMMDHNIGDHGPYSKILLDWVEPIIVDRSGIYTIPSFTTSGITLLVPANGTFSSIYDEYYLIDFYTFTGLNNLHMLTFFDLNRMYAGVRVSHVNSSLQYSSEYWPYLKYNNTDAKNKMITMLEADYKGEFHITTSYGKIAQASDFYLSGMTFGTEHYADYTSHKGNQIPFTMEVLNVSNDYATVKITFK